MGSPVSGEGVAGGGGGAATGRAARVVEVVAGRARVVVVVGLGGGGLVVVVVLEVDVVVVAGSPMVSTIRMSSPQAVRAARATGQRKGRERRRSATHGTIAATPREEVDWRLGLTGPLD
jgi:hypothetical protein